jgi:hypothetical protein
MLGAGTAGGMGTLGAGTAGGMGTLGTGRAGGIGTPGAGTAGGIGTLGTGTAGGIGCCCAVDTAHIAAITARARHSVDERPLRRRAIWSMIVDQSELGVLGCGLPTVLAIDELQEAGLILYVLWRLEMLFARKKMVAR